MVAEAISSVRYKLRARLSLRKTRLGINRTAIPRLVHRLYNLHLSEATTQNGNLGFFCFLLFFVEITCIFAKNIKVMYLDNVSNIPAGKYIS